MVRIVRELNRCHGAFAALGRQRPDPERLDAPVEATAAYGPALICQAQLAPGHDELEGAPAIAPGREDASPDAVLIQGSSPATPEAPPAASTGDNRPELPTTVLVLRSGAVGDASRRTFQLTPTAAPTGSSFETPASRAPQDEVMGTSGAARGSYNRPENLPQGLEKVDSAPGIVGAEASDLATHASGLQVTPPLVVPRHEGGEAPAAARPSDKRPENLPQDFEKVESAPGRGWLAEIASASEEATVGPSVPNAGFPFGRVRMTLNGVMAC